MASGRERETANPSRGNPFPDEKVSKGPHVLLSTKYRAAAVALAASALLLFFSRLAAPPHRTKRRTPRGLAEYAAAKYRTAEESFREACALATAAGDADTALSARNAIFRANRTVMEYSLDAPAAEAAVREKVPGITDEDISDWLDNRARTIISDNETLYFPDVASDYLFAHFDEIRKQSDTKLDFDLTARCAMRESRDLKSCTGCSRPPEPSVSGVHRRRPR